MNAETEKILFVEDSQHPWQTVDKGVQRKIMASDKELMMVKVAFEAGSVGTLHAHRHVQISYVESGRFEVEISGEKKILSAGDVFYIPPHLVHGVLCLEAGILVDAFSPMREDFLGA
jgi:quercetin dioxygenase-like cupin family protein